MTGFRSSQRGMTMIGWILVLGLIAFFTLLTLRLLPLYLNNFKIKSSLASLKEEPHITQKSKAEVWKLLYKRFYINAADTVEKKDVTITKSTGTMKIVVDYETRVNIAGNVDAVVSFTEKLDLVAN